jgi:hypothetical protein
MHSFYCLVGEFCVLADLLEEALLGWRPVTFLHSKEAWPRRHDDVQRRSGAVTADGERSDGGMVGDVWRVLVGLGWPVPLLLPLRQVVGCDGSAPLRLVQPPNQKELGLVSLFGPPPRQTVW